MSDETVYRVMTEILVQAPTAEAAVDAVVGDIDYLLSCETRLVGYSTLDAREFVEEDGKASEYEQFMQEKITYVQNKLNTDPYVRAVLGDALNEGGWALFEALWMRQYWHMKVEQLEKKDD